MSWASNDKHSCDSTNLCNLCFGVGEELSASYSCLALFVSHKYTNYRFQSNLPINSKIKTVTFRFCNFIFWWLFTLLLILKPHTNGGERKKEKLSQMILRNYVDSSSLTHSLSRPLLLLLFHSIMIINFHRFFFFFRERGKIFVWFEHRHTKNGLVMLNVIKLSGRRAPIMKLLLLSLFGAAQQETLIIFCETNRKKWERLEFLFICLQ